MTLNAHYHYILCEYSQKKRKYYFKIKPKGIGIEYVFIKTYCGHQRTGDT
mgnify:CR=1 FL=1